MICDHFISATERCKNTPMRAPRLVVPCTLGLEVPAEYRPLRMFTTLHFCEVHKGDIGAEALLVPKVKGDFEAVAKSKRPLDFKPDFDKAFIEWVLVTTPEYRQFLAALGYDGMMGAAKLDLNLQERLRQQLGVSRLAG